MSGLKLENPNLSCPFFPIMLLCVCDVWMICVFQTQVYENKRLEKQIHIKVQRMNHIVLKQRHRYEEPCELDTAQLVQLKLSKMWEDHDTQR